MPYYLCKFQLYDTVLLTAIITVYIRSSDIIHPIDLILYQLLFISLTFQPLITTVLLWLYQCDFYFILFYYFQYSYISDIIFFFVWIGSHSITPSRFIHTVNIRISFFVKVEFVCVCMYHIFFIHSFIHSQVISIPYLL